MIFTFQKTKLTYLEDKYMKQTAFISYTKQDREHAYEICRELEKRDIDCWIAPRNIDVGERWAEQIIKAIERCSNYIIILSDRSQSSQEVLKEITLASEMKKKIYAVCIDGCEPTGEFKYHLSITQRGNYKKGDVRVIDQLAAIIRGESIVQTVSVSAITEEKREERTGKEELEIVTYKELIGRGLTKAEIANQLVANDRELYPDIDDDNEGDVSQWENYLSSYPQTFRYMINTKNQIIGNWSMVTISADHYRKAKKGKLLESELFIDKTEYFMFGGIFYGYLLNLSINREYMSPKNLRRLFESFLDQLEEFAEDDIFFRSWCVNVFLPEHEKRYEGLGFQYVCDNSKTGKIYTLDFYPYPSNRVFQNRSRLKELYEEKFHFEFRQYKPKDYIKEEHLKQITGLIYDTDPYIYPAMFGGREQAQELVPYLIESNDAMFRPENLFVMEYEGKIAGIVLWNRGNLCWSKEKFINISEYLEIPVSPYLDAVTEKYIKSYERTENEDTISIINFCVAEEFRNLGLGSVLMDAFFKQHRNDRVELCVLEENPAARRLYEKYGFREVSRHPGFSVDERNLICIEMLKEIQ